MPSDRNRPRLQHSGWSFTWDPDKADENFKKHRGITFTEGATCFLDPHGLDGEENEADKRAHGTHPRGGRRLATDDATVAAIRAGARAGESFTAIGARTGLHRTSVARIVTGRRRRLCKEVSG